MILPALLSSLLAATAIAAHTVVLVQHGHAVHDGAATDPSMGVHGMALFGGADGLFASHLPLFRAPHDRRIVLKLELADRALDRAVRRELATRPTLWTIAPERFALARLLPGAADPITAFRADLVRGHFERGGTTVYRNVAVQVAAVLENSPITPTPAPVAKAAIYHAVGAGRTWFLVKAIDAKPDFDHVVALASGTRRSAGTVRVARRGVEAPSPALLAEAAGARSATSIYYEIDDLR